MIIKVAKSKTSGNVKIPGSKSHTIRAVSMLSLAEGRSISHPLLSKDAFSAVDVCRAFGARIDITGDSFIVDGLAGPLRSRKMWWMSEFGHDSFAWYDDCRTGRRDILFSRGLSRYGAGPWDPWWSMRQLRRSFSRVETIAALWW